MPGFDSALRLVAWGLFYVRGASIAAAVAFWGLSWVLILARPLRSWNAYIAWYGWAMNAASLLAWAFFAFLPVLLAFHPASHIPMRIKGPEIP